MLQFILSIAIVAIIVAAYLAREIMKKPAGSEKMQQISEIIHKGALTFLKKEYEVLAVFMVAVFLVMVIYMPEGGLMLGISFLLGGFLSALAGNIGMRI